MRRRRRNPYSRQLADLSRYLSDTDFDAYQAAQLLPDWIDEEGIEVSAKVHENIEDNSSYDAYDLLTAKQQKAFSKWAEKRLDRLEPGDLPSKGVFTTKGKRGKFEGMGHRQDWLVHFVDVIANLYKKGFIYGHFDMGTLALTTHKSERERRSDIGWNFAFKALSKDAVHSARKKKYGRHAVLFQAASVLAWHAGDEEDQAIFWGPDVRSLIPLYRNDNDEWEVFTKKDRVVYRGPYEAAVKWVIQNIHQYRRHIVWSI